jgi:hypothetical protein
LATRSFRDDSVFWIASMTKAITFVERKLALLDELHRGRGIWD